MAELLKDAISVLRDILTPITQKLGDPDGRKEFNQSIGFDPGPNFAAPTFPDGSAMDRYLKNEQEAQEEILLAQSLQEVEQIIEALRGMFAFGADTWYIISPDDNATREERVSMAISELVTLTINIFTLDYVRFRRPMLHNGFLITGIVDEMGQRAGSNGLMWQVIGDYLANAGKGFILKDDKSTHTTVETLALGFNVLKFICFPEAPFFLSGGFDTYPGSRLTNADNASKSMLSLAWYFQNIEKINGNIYLTLGFIPRTRSGGGFFAKLDVPANFEKEFSERFKLKLLTEGNLEFFYAADLEADISPGKVNRASLIFEYTVSPDEYILLKKPELALGYGKKHSIELRFSKDEMGILLKTDITVKFSKGKATSFPFKFIPDKKFEKNIPVSFGWTNHRGWFFNDAGTTGSASPETTGPAKRKVAKTKAAPGSTSAEDESKTNFFFFNFPMKELFGALSFQNIHIGLGKIDKSEVIESSLDFTFQIGGAFNLTVTRLGARIFITPRDDEKGFFGNDLEINFKSPTGIGMTVDVSAVKGGGFLSLDSEKGEYSGALELSIDLQFCAFDVKAFGLIQTKIPGGAKDDYSLFVVISSDFEPVPLVFGLTLNGVGGLFGHNRTIDISLIQTEMRSPYLENILFLKDPIANVSRLISDSGRYFPVGIDKTLLGISLIIGYGVPTVFELRLAVIILKPDNKILIPGYLRLQTPQKTKTLQLQINFLAVLDLQEGYLFFRAELVDSKLATFKLTGSMVLAIGWGDSDGLFALTIGGFHPSFKDFPQIKALPNAFKGLDRIRLSFWDEGKNHFYVDMYLAMTSNSYQVGARAYLHVEGPAGFNIDGQLGFDVLWEPETYFEASIDARIDFRRHDDVLAGVSLDAKLTGPVPKHIEGKAKLKICWFLTVSIPFSKTWGHSVPTVEKEIIDLEEILKIQLEDDRNWRAEIPDFHHLNVTLRKDATAQQGVIKIQPLGAIIFSQNALPLNFKIQKIGSKKAKAEKTFSIDKVSSNGTEFTDVKPADQLFAPGHFVPLKDDEKLTRASFERMNSGIRIGDTGISQFPKPFVKARQPEYELDYIRPEVPRPRRRNRFIFSENAFSLLSRNAAVSTNTHSWQSGRGQSSGPKKQQIQEDDFVIGTTEDLKLFQSTLTDGLKIKSKARAEQLRDEILAQEPSLKGKIQVLTKHELTV